MYVCILINHYFTLHILDFLDDMAGRRNRKIVTMIAARCIFIASQSMAPITDALMNRKTADARHLEPFHTRNSK
jgi:TRAP-type C4-dicarboxylate transport system permease small subunit